MSSTNLTPVSGTSPFDFAREGLRTRRFGDEEGSARMEERLKGTNANQEVFEDTLTGGDQPVVLFERGGTPTEVKRNVLGMDVTGTASGPKFKVTGNADFKRVGTLGAEIDLDLNIKAEAGRAGLSTKKEFKFTVGGEEVSVKLDLSAEVMAGINGDVHLKLYVGKDGVRLNVGGEGFAGARGTLSGTLGVDVNGKSLAQADLKLQAFIGAAAGMDIDWSLKEFRAKAYAAVGAGFGVELHGVWDPKQAVKAAAAVALPGHQGW